jgi:hypothetical protein
MQLNMNDGCLRSASSYVNLYVFILFRLNNIKNSLTFTVYNEFIGLNGKPKRVAHCHIIQTNKLVIHSECE